MRDAERLIFRKHKQTLKPLHIQSKNSLAEFSFDRVLMFMFFFLFVCIYLIHAFIILLLGCRINFLPDLLTYEFSPPSAPTRTSRPGALLSCRETVCGFTWPSGWTSSIFFCHLVLHSLATGFFFFPPESPFYYFPILALSTVSCLFVF